MDLFITNTENRATAISRPDKLSISTSISRPGTAVACSSVGLSKVETRKFETSNRKVIVQRK